MGAAFQIRKGEKEFLGQIASRLSASRSFIKSIHLYAYPAGAYFSMKKSRQKSFRGSALKTFRSVRPDRKVCDLPDLGLDDAYKVLF